MRSRQVLRLAILVSLVAGALASAPVASAQPPSNDEITGATVVVEPLPYQDVINISQATGASTDPGCSSDPGDLNNPTVWYSYTPTENALIQANTFGSSYDTTLSAFRDNGGGLDHLDCNDDFGGLQSALNIDVLAGETILFMVGSFSGQPVDGELVFTVGPQPPPLEVELQVDTIGTVAPRDGNVTITGNVTCSAPSNVELFAQMEQRSGRVIISGFGFDFFECDGETPFTLTIVGENGLFTAGKAQLFAEAFAFSEGGADGSASVEQEIRLRGGRR